jgi:hypothetical protein
VTFPAEPPRKAAPWREVREEPCYSATLHQRWQTWRLEESPGGDVEAFAEARELPKDQITTIARGCSSLVIRWWHFCELCQREHLRNAGKARGAAKAPPAAAPDELFAEGGNPPIRYTPREWTDAGRPELPRLPMSLIPVEALDAYAAAQTMSARRNRAKGLEDYALEDERHARLARGWAAHLRAVNKS